MRTALILCLVACGNEARSPEPTSTRVEPTTVPADKPVPRCKSGEHVCSGDAVAVCEDGRPERTVTTCRGGCKQGKCVETCGANDVELIYTVSSDRALLSFDPKKLPGDPFRKIGELSCDRSSSPFSMAVDRTGIAWVLYQT
ncbi:MAG: hypothetical protein H0V17_32630, partial [Deltaproteobacteria bacterium]|nr:hypothetical protein [Deltaproteobacteria bacterium]